VRRATAGVLHAVATRLRQAGQALRPRAGRVALALALLAALPFAVVAGWAWYVVAGLDLEGSHEASLVYAASQPLAPGTSVEATDLAGTLRRLRYREIPGPPQLAGQFRRTAAAWEIFLHARDDPRAQEPARRVRLVLEGRRIAAVVDPEGAGLDGIELEPEVVSGLGDTTGRLRRPVRLAAVPRHLVQAVLAAEDHRFFDHGGVDLRAVLRAVWVNVRRGEVAQGGSTLTQQLVKNLLLTPQRTWDRKLREAALAVVLEWRHGKPQILEAYLNTIYLGQHGGTALYGVGAASQRYFGKDVDALGLAEAALLAGMIRAPNSYAPVQNPDRARERRDAVLARLRELGWIDEAARARAAREPVRVRVAAPPAVLAPYFQDHVRAQIEQLSRDDRPAGGGLRIYTTLDPVLQRAAERAVSRGLDQLESRFRHLRRREPGQRLQAALVALDPATGEVRALVGGRDYAQSQFNRAVFKPLVYLAALRFGPDGQAPRFTPASLVSDEPLTLRVGSESWSPRNHEDRFEGTVTLRRALEQSLNAATVRIGIETGLPAVIHTAREVGLTSPLQPVPALTLGSFEVTPMELATAYATLANGGERLTPTLVRAVVDRPGQVAEPPRRRTPALRPAEAYLLTHLLRGVVERGTGAGVRDLGLEGVVAGKTGTTNDGRDAWFVGFTPRLVALVWVGFDEAGVLRLTGGQAALPIWADFVRTAMAVLPSEGFPVPASVTLRDIDPATGKLATRYCPVVFREAFLAGTEPQESCPDHGGVLPLVESLFRRFLDFFGGSSPAPPSPR
jgi:penicillin-binding protein 1B